MSIQSTVPADLNKGPILFYDGVCGLCNKAVQFIIRHDRRELFRFATLQSDIAREVLAPFGMDTSKLETAILLYKGRIYTESSMALMNGRLLGGIWHIARLGYAVPKPWRDAVYKWVGRNRYKWFGTVDACQLPTPALRARLLA